MRWRQDKSRRRARRRGRREGWYSTGHSARKGQRLRALRVDTRTRAQEGRRGSEEAVPGPSVFPSGEPGVLGDSWGSQEGCQGPFRPSGQNRVLPLRRRCVRGSGAGTLGVPLGGTRRVGGLLGVAGRLSGTVSPFRAEQGTSLESRGMEVADLGHIWGTVHSE